MGISLSDYRCYDGRAEKTEAARAVRGLVNKHRDSPASTGECVSIHTKEDFLFSRPYTWTLYQRKTNSQSLES